MSDAAVKSIRRIFFGFFSVVMAIWLISGTALAAAPETIVYVASSGECYHREDCAYLKSKNEMTLAEAVAAGYRPCSRCDPPVLDTDISETDEIETSTEPSAEPSVQISEAEVESNETQEATVQSAAPQAAEASAESANRWKILFICAASAAGVLTIIVVVQNVGGKRGKRQKAKFTLPIKQNAEDVPEHIKEELETGQWQEINSNLISRIRYEDGKLFVKFSNGEMYCYFDVPEQVFRGWYFDRFPTMFFQAEIKPNFAFVQVDRPE